MLKYGRSFSCLSYWITYTAVSSFWSTIACYSNTATDVYFVNFTFACTRSFIQQTLALYYNRYRLSCRLTSNGALESKASVYALKLCNWTIFKKKLFSIRAIFFLQKNRPFYNKVFLIIQQTETIASATFT